MYTYLNKLLLLWFAKHLLLHTATSLLFRSGFQRRTYDVTSVFDICSCLTVLARLTLLLAILSGDQCTPGSLRWSPFVIKYRRVRFFRWKIIPTTSTSRIERSCTKVYLILVHITLLQALVSKGRHERL